MRCRAIATFLLMLFSSAVFAQPSGAMMQDIERAFDKSDFAGITGYMGQVTTLTLNTSQASYSPSQAQMVLRDFFNRNPVKDFKVMHVGESANKRSSFMIGRLATSTGAYRVYLHFKLKEGSAVLSDVRLDKQ